MTLLPDQLGPGEQHDVLPVENLRPQMVDHPRAVPAIREQLPPAGHMPSHRGGRFHDVHSDAHVGEGEGRPEARDPGPDHEGLRDRLAPEGVERPGTRGVRHRRLGDRERLLRRRGGIVSMGPGTLLPDVRLRVLVRVQPRS
jgi:hypothetical protein